MKARSQGAFALIAVFALVASIRNSDRDALFSRGRVGGLPSSRSFSIHVQDWALLSPHLREDLAILPAALRHADPTGSIENGRALVDCDLPLTQKPTLDFICPAIHPSRIAARVLQVDYQLATIVVEFPSDAIEASFGVRARWGGTLTMCVAKGIPDAFELKDFVNLHSDEAGRFWFQTQRTANYYGYLIESRSGNKARSARGWFRLTPDAPAREWNPGGRWLRVRLNESTKSFSIYCDDPFGLPPHPLLKRSVYRDFSEEPDAHGTYPVWIAEGTKRVFMNWPVKGSTEATAQIHRSPAVLGAEIRIPFR